MSSDEQKLRYLAAAHHKIRGLTVDEENAVREYEDLANMLELAGSKTICATIRKIAESEKRHALDLKTSATMLNQAIKQLERIRELKKMEKTSVPLRNIKDNPHIPVRAFKIEGDGGYTPREWFEMSMKGFRHRAPSTKFEDYDYVQLVPLSSYRRFPSGNDGSQGWRHRRTGWTIPDYCRQSGGYPEIWTRTNKAQLEISQAAPIWSYLIIH